MGLFGFGKKKAKKALEDETQVEDTLDETVDTAEDAVDEVADETENDAAEQTSTLAEPAAEYVGRGEERGPWDIDDENVPDYDEYLDMGAIYLPFVQGMEFRIKADRATNQVMGITVTLGSSSLELSAFAAPKSAGLWDDVRADICDANANAKEGDGVFGTELTLPVRVNGGKSVVTRIVGVDGPRWMLRGVFSGKAASKPSSDEAETLNNFFANIVVDRGGDPLAPRDVIPMHMPVTPAERRAAEEAAEDQESTGKEHLDSIPDKPEGPFDQDQQTEVQTTLTRGPMFSEVR